MSAPLTNEKPLKVWWIPQVPGARFDVYVDSVAEGVKVMDFLARYDTFQFENRIKPDYCNAGGILMLVDGDWCDWYDEATGEEDPARWLREQARA